MEHSISLDTLRNMKVSATLPSDLLNDPDLNVTHLRFYALVQLFEANSPDGAAFTYDWAANTLGLSRRNVIRYASKLKKKGYLSRSAHKIPSETEGPQYIWFWKTVR